MKIILNAENFQVAAQKRGWLLTLPPRRQAASATQTLCKCLVSKNVCIFQPWGGLISIRGYVTLLCATRVFSQYP